VLSSPDTMPDGGAAGGQPPAHFRCFSRSVSFH
jgi:hypothetical protein